MSRFDLIEFLDASPVSVYAADNLVQLFQDQGWQALEPTHDWVLEPGGGYIFRWGPGCVVALTAGEAPTGWKIAAAHTDSPALKLKLNAHQALPHGLHRWGVEVYGGPLLATWTDRTLGVAGQVWYSAESGPRSRRLRTEGLAVIPNLAIHYNRDANKGTALDPQTHLSALADVPSFTHWKDWLSRRLSEDPERFLAADIFLYDTHGAHLGASGLLQSGRLDNLAGCHAIAEALLNSTSTSHAWRLALFLDHEEIGSRTAWGADSGLLPRLLERLNRGFSTADAFRQQNSSFLVSVDAAHGLHPNFADRHDSTYAPALGGGPVLKASARHSYATTAETEARFRWMTRAYEGPWQEYIMRSDLAPGSTVGPLLAASANLNAVDVGIPLWAMHSVRETAHQADQNHLIDLLTAYWR
ncbi:MAG: M18 family aminopeptidase [Spirochaetales bacterium]|nr:M18 family aminopeptidase [Spirochaetales bacterium]